MQDDDRDVWEHLSFLAAPDRVLDWRMVLLYDVVAEAGMLDDLPATAAELARPRGLDAHAVRVVLEALVPWGVVDSSGDRFSPGPRSTDAEEAAVLCHHARSMRSWCKKVPERLGVDGGDIAQGAEGRRWGLALWMEALEVNARRSAPTAVDACLRRMPAARSVLDLAGGHGEYALEFARRGLQAVMQDRAEVIDLARRRGRLEAAGVRLFAGDLFETLPPRAFDVVFCAGLSYTFGESRNRQLFDRVKSVLEPSGTLAVHTFLRGQDARAAVFAVQMLGTGGGDTHSEAEYRQWLTDAGYREVEVSCLPRPPESLVLASK